MLQNLHRLELIICMTQSEPPCSPLLEKEFPFPPSPLRRQVEGLPKLTQALWMGACLSARSVGTQSAVSLPGVGLGLSWVGGWGWVSQPMCSWMLRLLTSQAGILL